MNRYNAVASAFQWVKTTRQVIIAATSQCGTYAMHATLSRITRRQTDRETGSAGAAVSELIVKTHSDRQVRLETWPGRRSPLPPPLPREGFSISYLDDEIATRNSDWTNKTEAN